MGRQAKKKQSRKKDSVIVTESMITESNIQINNQVVYDSEELNDIFFGFECTFLEQDIFFVPMWQDSNDKLMLLGMSLINRNKVKISQNDIDGLNRLLVKILVNKFNHCLFFYSHRVVFKNDLSKLPPNPKNQAKIVLENGKIEPEGYFIPDKFYILEQNQELTLIEKDTFIPPHK